MEDVELFDDHLFRRFVAIYYGLSEPEWMVFYGAAGVACVLAIRNSQEVALPLATGVIALLIAATLAPAVIGKIPFAEVFRLGETEPKHVGTARRLVCLVIVTFWMTVLTLVSLLRRRAAHPAS